MTSIDRISFTQFLPINGNSVNGGGFGRGNLRTRIDAVTTDFSNSFLNINSALTSTEVTKSSLEKILNITDQLIVLAEEAAGSGTSRSRRKTLDRQFQPLIEEFRDVLSDASKNGVDLLDVEDLTEVLTAAGLDTQNATNLARTLESIAGTDGLLGYEPISSDPVSVSEKVIKRRRATINIGDTVTVGDGTFGAIQATGLGSNASTAILEDLDGDGNLDLIEGLTGIDSLVFSAGNGDGTFQARTTLFQEATSSGEIFDIVSGDFDGDGNQDLLYSLSNNNSLNFLVGNGDGTFSIGTSIGGIGSAASIEVLDVNGDNNLDFVVAREKTGDEVITFLGNGTGAFTQGDATQVGLGPIAVSSGDFDGDGVKDLAVADEGGITVLTGTGSGSFTLNTTIATANGLDVQIYDINNDGRDDIIATDISTEGLIVAIGNGDGSFLNPDSYTFSPNAKDIEILDINGDGNEDIIARASDDATIRLATGNGDGTFNLGITLDLGATSVNTANFGDLNNDGATDIVATINGPARVVRLGNTQVVNLDDLVGNGTYTRSTGASGGGDGTGAFSGSTTYDTSAAPTSIELYDFDGDGNLDIVTADGGINATNPYVSVQRGNGDGTFQAYQSFATGAAAADVIGGTDIDGDSNIDLVVAAGGTGEPLGTFTSATANEFDTSDAPTSIELYDFDGDGNLDIVTADTGSGNTGENISVQRGNGDGTFRAYQTFASGGDVRDVIGGVDLDGDSNIDLITVNDEVAFSQGTFTAEPTDADTSDSPTSVELYDFDGDGNLDIVSADPGISGTGENVSVQLGNGDGSFRANQIFNAGGDIQDVATGTDLDGDSNVDLVVTTIGDINQGDRSFAAGTSADTSAGPTSVELYDFNGDGNLDLVTADEGAGSDGRNISVSLGNGNGTFQAFQTFDSRGEVQDVEGGVDFDGDGNIDVVAAVTGYSTGESLTYSFDTSQQASSIELYDFDGDGNLDIVSGQAESQAGSQIGVMLGNGDGSFAAEQNFSTGGPVDDIATGEDLDSDGNVDVVFASSGSNTTYSGFDSAVEISLFGPNAVEIYDVDGDGNLDIVSALRNGQFGTGETISIQLGNGDGEFQAAQTYQTLGAAWDIAGGVDVDGDGNEDLLVANARGFGENPFGAVALLSGNGDGTFRAAVTIQNTGDNAVDIRTADFDNDGNIDVITANNSDDAATIFLGNGDGTFDSAITIDDLGTANVRAVEVLDADGDGNTDIVLMKSGEVILHAGNGDGTFVAPTTFDTITTGSDDTDLIKADVDSDGNVDIIVGSNNRFEVLYSNGDGTFEAPISYDADTTSGAITDVKAADFNGDGNVDIVVSKRIGDDVAVILGNGDRTFQAATVVATDNNGYEGVGAGDFNNDGFDDIAAGASASQQMEVILASTATSEFAEVYQLSGNGDGNFGSFSAIATVSSNVSQVVLADIDDDGNSDIITANDTDGSVSYLLGNGDGTFNAVSTLTVGGTVKDVVALDYDGDGNLDLAVTTDEGGGKVELFSGNGDGTFEPLTVTTGDGTFSTVSTLYDGGAGAARTGTELFDFDGDGNLDYVYGENNGVRVGMGNGDGTFSLPSLNATANGMETTSDRFLISDFDGDGNADIAAIDASTTELSILSGNGDGTFSLYQTFDTAVSGAFEDADVDNDGNLDLLLYGNSGDATVLYGNSDGTFSAAVTLQPDSISILGGFTVDDFDGDGNVDLFWKDIFNNEILYQTGNGDGTFNATQTIADSAFSMHLDAIDVDGDGNLDLVGSNQSSGQAATIRLGNGNGTFDAAQLFDTSTDSGIQSARGALEFFDFNSDGNLDIVTPRSSGGPDYTYASILLGNGDGTFQAFSTAATNSDLFNFTVGDIDNDGIVDLVTHDFQGVIAFEGQGSSTAVELTSADANQITTADVDGDGNNDLVVSKDSSIGVFYSNGNGTFTAEQEYDLGSSGITDLRVADLDGDGNLDLAASTNVGDTVTTLTGNGDRSFNLAVTQLSGADYTGLATGDLNGDGSSDIAAADFTNNEIDVTLSGVSASGAALTLLSGNGNGTFDSAALAGITGSDISQVKFADIDGDGNTDIFTANNTDGSITYLTSNGDGTFDAARTLAVGGNVADVTSLDINGDGNLDLVAGTDDDNGRLAVFYGNGDGTFQTTRQVGDGTLGAPTTLAASSSITGPNFVVSGDFNSDGNADYIVGPSTGLADYFDLVIGNGDGTFNAATTLDSGIGLFNYAEAVDIDGDGNLDLVSSGDNGAATQIAVQRGNGDGTFRAIQAFNTGDSADNFVIADFNNDGTLDIAESSTPADRSIKVSFGNGDGTFLASISTSDSFGDAFLSGADVDGDGNVDIFAGNDLFYGNGDGTFEAAVASPVPQSGNEVSTFGDLDDDGNIDIVAVDSGGQVSSSLSNGDRTFNPGQPSINLGGVQGQIELADLNDDGNLDVVVTTTTGSVSVAFGNGDGTFLEAASYEAGNVRGTGNLSAFTIDDFNNDGSLDFLQAYDSTTNGVKLLSGGASGVEGGSATVKVSGDPDIVTSADVDGDGNTDIITASSDRSYVSVFYSNGDGTFAQEVTYDYDLNGAVDIEVTDLDGDGSVDVAIAGNTSLSNIYGNGDRTFTAGDVTFRATTNGGITAGDINKDGINDLGIADISGSEVDIFTQSAEQGGRLSILSGNGDGTFREDAVVGFTGDDIDEVVLADINGDGNTDIITENRTERSVTVFLGNGDGSFQVAATYLTAGTPAAIAVSDVTGDGEIDLVVSNSLNNGFVFQGNGDGTFQNASVTLSLGADPNRLRIADVDGDGNNDIISLDNGNDEFSIIYGNGDGTFDNRAVFGSQLINLTGIELTDLDADGNLDVVLSSSITGVEVQFGNGNGTFGASISFSESLDYRDLAIGDVNNDGLNDIAASDFTNGQIDIFEQNASLQSVVSLLSGNGDGSFDASSIIGSVGSNVSEAILADLDGDGNQDVITANDSDGTVTYFLGNGDGTFDAIQTAQGAGGVISNVTAFDSDGDGNTDIVFSEIVSEGPLSFQVSDNTSTGIRQAEIQLIDVNGDGRADEISAGELISGGDAAVQVQLANSDGTFLVPNNFIVGDSSVEIQQMLVGPDLDGDGNQDIVVAANNGSNGIVYILGGNGDGTFGSAVTGFDYSGTFIGAKDRLLLTEDYDGDGNSDLVLAAYNGTNYEVLSLTGNGDSTFTLTDTLTLGSQIRSLDNINIDNQSNPDILVSTDVDDNGNQGKVEVFQGLGDGTFSSTQPDPSYRRVNTELLANPSNTPSLIADVDGAGREDLILLRGSEISVSLVTGDAVLGAEQTFASIVNANGSTTEDIDGDGNLDVIVAASSGDVGVILGNGDGTFQAVSTYNTEAISLGNMKVFTGDFDGDGNSDLFFTGDTIGSADFAINFGNGDGTFEASRSFESSNQFVYAGGVGDFDGDGVDDVVTGFGASNIAQVSLSNGDNTFSIGSSFSLGTYEMAVDDIDGDGNLDIIGGDLNGIQVALGNGNGTFQAVTTFGYAALGASGAIQELAIDDINNDGNLDYIVTGGNSGLGTYIGFGNGNGTFNAPSLEGGLVTSQFGIGDLNGDGTLDIAAGFNGSESILLVSDSIDEGVVLSRAAEANNVEALDYDGDGLVDDVAVYEGSSFEFYTNTTGTTFVSSGSHAADDGVDIEFADVNGDGSLDLAVRRGGFVDVSISNGDGTFGAATSFAVAFPNTGGLTIGDVNNDGRDDILVNSESASIGFRSRVLLSNGGGRADYTQISVLGGNGDGTFSAATSLGEVGSSTGTSAITNADIDGDGNTDIIAVNSGENTFSVLYSNGDGTYTAETSYRAGQPGTDIEIVDYNGDSNLDVVFSTTGGYRALRGNGDRTFDAGSTFGDGNNYQGVAVADLDGDGAVDIALSDFAQSDVNILLQDTSDLAFVSLLSGNGDGTFDVFATIAGTGGDIKQVILSDIDGDGNEDVITANDSNNSVTYFLSNGDGTFDAVRTLDVNGTANTVTTLDVNGDGNLDIAVGTNSAGNEVRIFLGNGNGDFQTSRTVGDGTFGAASTIALSNPRETIEVRDIDGDGNADLIALTEDGLISMLGNGNATFNAGQTFSAGNIPSTTRFALADLNGDGNLDFVAPSSVGISAEITVGLGNGDGTFQSPNTYDAGSLLAISISGVEVADFDNDGNADVLLLDDTTNEISLFRGNGNGTFNQGIVSDIGPNTNDIVVSDFNNDGNLDFITTTLDDGVTLSVGNGDGTFALGVSFLAGDFTSRIVATDFNGDGNTDIVVTDTGTAQVLFGNGNGTFVAAQTYSLPNGSSEAELRDVDGDGNLDLVSISSSTDLVSILRGNGDGTFQAETTFIIADDPRDFTLGDLNNDGVIDIISNNRGDDSLTYVLGNTTTTDGGAIDLDTGATPTLLKSSDVDGDGNVDLVQINQNESTFSVLYSNGDGTFDAEVEYDLGATGLTDFQVADLDGDSNIDIIATSNGGNSVTYRFGNGDRTFDATVSAASGNAFTGIAVGDLDGDSDLDAVVSDFNNTDVQVLLQGALSAGDGGFETGGTPVALTSGDIDGDGNIDLISADSYDNTVSILLGNGDATFNQRTTLAAVSSPTAVEIADLDNDGNSDLIVKVSGTSSLLMFGNGDGSFDSAQTIQGIRAEEILVLDVNGDGNLDIIERANNLEDRFSVSLGNGDGTFNQREIFAGGGSGDTARYTIAAGDLNNDGQIDIIQGSDNTNSYLVSFGNGDGTFNASASYGLNGNARSIQVADIDSNGISDLVIGSTDGGVTALRGNGDGTFQAGISYSGGSSLTQIEVVDINEDGAQDILVTDDTENNLNVLLGNAGGTFAAARTYQASSGPIDLISADLNNDGASDVAVLSQDGSSIDVFTGNPTTTQVGDLTFQTPSIAPVATSPTDVQLADTNQDGILDAIVTDSATNSVSVFEGTGDGTFLSALTINIGFSVNDVQVAEIDNDGIQDLIITSTDGDRVAIVTGNGNKEFTAPTFFATGDGPSDVAVADLNGDGDADIVSANINDNSVTVLFSNGDGTFSGPNTLTALSGSSSVTIADLDADGSNDIIVGGESSFDVLVLQGNGNGTFNLGVTAEINGGFKAVDLETADVDGDGNLDVIAASSSQVQILFGNGTTNLSVSPNDRYGMNDGIEDIEITDFNNDGAFDIVGTSSTLEGFRLLEGYSDGTFKDSTVIDTSSTSNGLALGDLNGDGATDILATSVSNGSLIRMLSNTQDDQSETEQETTITKVTSEKDTAATTSTDPLERSVDSLAEAILTLETLTELKEEVENDLSGIGNVLEDLRAANAFARTGLEAAQELTPVADTFSSAEALARNISDQILAASPGTSLDVYRPFDAILVQRLILG